MDARTSLLQSIGLLVLRVGAGGFMATHGWGKVQWVIEGKFEEFADPLGFMGKTLALICAAGAEFVCSLMVAVGLATRLAAAPVVFTMAVAAFVVHKADPLLMGGGAAKEPALLYLIAFLTILFTGPGRFSLDAWFWPWLRSRKKAAPAG